VSQLIVEHFVVFQLELVNCQLELELELDNRLELTD